MKNTIFKIIRYVGTGFSFFNLLMWFALRPCWSGISSTLGYKGGANTFLLHLPLVICIALLVILLADLILKKIFNKNWLHILFLVIGVVFFVAEMVVIALGAIDYMRFVWPKFFTELAVTIVLLLLYFLLFVYPKTSLKDIPYFKYGAIGLASVLSIAILANLTVNWITCSPVVYAVEDKYQIVFTTSTEATGYVEVGGKTYYDVYNGTTKTFDKVHKIEVPMAELDAAKEYTVHSQKNIYAGPFGGYLGRDVSKKVSFKPVNTDDGIQYLSFSDVHMNLSQAAKTASYVENYDFLVLAGDLISVVDSFEDAQFNNEVAYSITKGQIPVVYARGNHDVKGRYGQELHKFVGAKDEKFYYTFYFKDIYGVVLDLGEDHDDDWWEYYGTAHYEDYHNEQIAFLKNEIAKNDYEHYPYHLVISHIPIPFVNSRLNHEKVKKEMTTLLNQMDVDMYLCGHQHQLMIFEPGLITPFAEFHYNPDYKDKKYGGYLTDFNFPSFMVSKPGFTFSDSTALTGAKSQVGFYVDADLTTNKEKVHYLNSRGEKVSVMNMFAQKDYGNEITIDLATKEFLPA